MTYSIKDVESAVEVRFCLAPGAMRSRNRYFRVARPRHIAFYLAREVTGASYPQLGRYFGGLDHTTVLHGYRRVSGLMRGDPALRATVEQCLLILAHRGSWMARARADIENCPTISSNARLAPASDRE